MDRSDYQTELRDRLATAPVTQIVAVGGFGKSSLAAWAYDQYQACQFQKRVWVSLRRALPFERFARYGLQELGRPVKDPQANEELLLRELMLRLNDPNGGPRLLLVLDQLEAAQTQPDWPWYEQFLQTWHHQGRHSALLVTSRIALPRLPTLHLGGLTEAEGITFFDAQNITGTQRGSLVTLAGGHPLLLKLAAAWTMETYGARVDAAALDFFAKLFSQYQGVDPRLL